MDKRDRVTVGSKVLVNYEDLRDLEAVVSHVHERERGIISVRFHKSQLSPMQLTRMFVHRDGYVPLVVEGDDWELIEDKIQL